MSSKFSDKLSHLSESEIHSMMEEYYSHVRVSDIMAKYKITGVPDGALASTFPPMVHRDKLCEYCGIPLISPRHARGTPSKKRDNSLPPWDKFFVPSEVHCPICNHFPSRNNFASEIFNCNCHNCTERRAQLDLKKNAEIRRFYSQPQEKVSFDSLSFSEKVFFGTMCSALGNDNSPVILPFPTNSVKVAPTKSMFRKMCRVLAHPSCRAFVVSPDSDVKAFDKSAKNFPRSYMVEGVTYTINVESEVHKNIREKVLEPAFFTPDSMDDALQMWFDVAVEECREYLLFRLNGTLYHLSRREFESVFGEATEKEFCLLLNDFSVSQIFYFIWRAVADAGKNKHSNNVVDYVMKRCSTFAQNAAANNRSIEGYKRPYSKSELSRYLFHSVLKIDDDAFTEVPSIQRLEQSLLTSSTDAADHVSAADDPDAVSPSGNSEQIDGNNAEHEASMKDQPDADTNQPMSDLCGLTNAQLGRLISSSYKEGYSDGLAARPSIYGEADTPIMSCQFCKHSVLEEDMSVGIPEHYICDNPSLPEEAQDSEELGRPDVDCPYFEAIIHDKCDVCGRTINVPLWLWDKVYHGMFSDIVCCSTKCMPAIKEREKKEVECG